MNNKAIVPYILITIQRSQNIQRKVQHLVQMSRPFFAKRNLIGSNCNSFSVFTLANIVQLALFKFAQFQEARNTFVDMHMYTLFLK